MSIAIQRAFFFLLSLRAAHAFEEYRGELWNELQLTHFISGLFSQDLASGFVIANGLFLLFGLWCLVVPIRRRREYAGAVIWLWILIEYINGFSHIVLAISAGGYFPGLYTAPFLLFFASYLAALTIASAGARQQPESG